MGTLLRDSWKDFKGRTSGNIRRLVLYKYDAFSGIVAGCYCGCHS